LQSFSGYAVRGLFYNIVGSVDREYASLLHDSRMLAPFSVSPVCRVSGESGFHPCFDKLSRGLLRVNFTLLDGRLTDILMKFIQEGLGGGEFNIGKDKVTLHALSFQQISYERLFKDSSDVRSFKVNFLTPTYFRQTPRDMLRRYGKRLDKSFTVSPYRFIPLPDPVLLFKSVARLWRKFSNINLDLQDFMRWLETGGVAVSGFPDGIRTYIVHEHPTTKKWSVGFTGTVYFSIVKDIYSPEKAKIVNTLLKFAEYTNVGGGRTAGLGLIKYSVKNEDVSSFK